MTRLYAPAGLWLSLAWLFAQPLAAQHYPGSQIDTDQAQPEPAVAGWPGLRLHDAQVALNLIRRAHFLTRVLADGRRQTVVARDVRARFVGRSRLPPPDGDGRLETRWDLVVNGYDIDPRHFLIRYRGQQVNLAVLFSYAVEFKPGGQAPIWLDDSP